MLSDTYTEADIERAARILCEKRGKKPTDMTNFSSARMGECFVPDTWLTYYKREILAYLSPNKDVDDALKQVKEQK